MDFPRIKHLWDFLCSTPKAFDERNTEFCFVEEDKRVAEQEAREEARQAEQAEEQTRQERKAKAHAERATQEQKAREEAEKRAYWDNVDTSGADDPPEREDAEEAAGKQQNERTTNYSPEVEAARRRWVLSALFTKPEVEGRYPIMIDNADSDDFAQINDEYELLMEAAA